MRFSVSLEIDAAALFFPIAVAGRLRAGRAPDLPRPGRRLGTLGRGVHRGGWKIGGRRLSVAFGALGHPRSVPESARYDYGKPVQKQRLSLLADEI